MTTDDSLTVVQTDPNDERPAGRPRHLRGCLLDHDQNDHQCAPRWQCVGTAMTVAWSPDGLARLRDIPVLRAHLVHEIESAAAYRHQSHSFTMFDPTVSTSVKIGLLLLDIADASTPDAGSGWLRASLIQLAADAASWAQSLPDPTEKGTTTDE